MLAWRPAFCWRSHIHRATSVSCILFSAACAFDRNPAVQRGPIAKAAAKAAFSDWIFGRATANMLVTNGAMGLSNLAHGGARSPNNRQRKKRNAPIQSSTAHQKARKQFLFTHPTFGHSHTRAQRTPGCGPSSGDSWASLAGTASALVGRTAHRSWDRTFAPALAA